MKRIFRAIAMLPLALALSAAPLLAAEIHELATNGDAGALESLLDAHPELVNAVDERGSTPLHLAADAGSTEALILLIERGAGLEARDADGDTPLHWAAYAGRADVVAVLIESGAEIDAADTQRKTPLHYAAMRGHLEVAEALLNAGAEVSAAAVRDETPLHVAALRSRPELVRLLVAHGADIERSNDYGRPALLLVARETGDVETARVLIELGADVGARDRSDWDALSFCAWRGFKELSELVLESGVELDLVRDGAVQLQFSAQRGMDRLFFMLLQENDLQGGVLEIGPDLLAEAARGGSPAIVGELISRGLDPNVADVYGLTSLHHAASRGRLACSRVLAAAGADLDSRNRLGETAWDIAVKMGCTTLADMLSGLGCDTSGQRFPALEGPYFGQDPPGAVPRRFAVGIVDIPMMEHTCPTFSPDGEEACWPISLLLSESGYSTGRLRTSRVVDGRWTAPALAWFSAEPGIGEGDPTFSPDGRRLYFYSRRPLISGGPRTSEHIWFLEREGDEWSEPRVFSDEINRMDAHWQIGVDLKGDVYFAATDGQNHGGTDIWCAPCVDGKPGSPVNLGEAVNSAGNESTPFIAPDGSYLLFSRWGAPGESSGGTDLYISRRLDDGGWSEAENLGGAVNTPAREMCPRVTPDGKYLFFLTSRDEGEGVYWMSAKAIPALAGDD